MKKFDANIRKKRLGEKEIISLTENQEKKYGKKKNIFTYAKNEFNDVSNEDRNYCSVRDHCRYTRKYRDAAHNICN